MADVGKAIKSILLANADVIAIISTKAYPIRAPQSVTAPYVVWHALNTEMYGTKANPSNNGQSPVDRVDVQINCIASTHTAATELAIKVRAALDRYPDATINGVKINGIDCTGDRDDFDDEMNLFVSQLDFSIRRKNL